MFKTFARWMVLIAVLVGIAAPFAPTLAQGGSEYIWYEDPQGRFRAPVPAHWTDESTADYGRFTGPSGMTATLWAGEAADADAGLAAALAVVAPDLADASPLQVVPANMPNGSHWTQYIYIQQANLAALLVQVESGTAYAILLQGSKSAFTSGQEQVQAILVGFSPSYGEEALTPITPEMLADFEAFVTEALEAFDVPGASVAIVQGGEVVYTGGFGVTEVGGVPVTPETQFMIGSTTKSFTTLLAAILVDEGAWTWDTPVTDVLPAFALSDPDATPQIAVRDLFNMSSGLPRYDFPFLLGYLTPAQIVAELANVPVLTPPGEAYHYSNLMVGAGGYLAAVAAGYALDDALAGYMDLLQARVFDPLGMSATTVDFDAAMANADHALPYAQDPRTGERLPVPPVWESVLMSSAPAGAIWSNAQDMARYLLMQTARGVSPDGTRIVSEENLAVTQSPEVEMAGPAYSYGMGWMVSTYRGQPMIDHGGNTSGFTSECVFLPESGLGVWVGSNLGLSNAFNQAVRQYVFEMAFGLEHAGLDPAIQSQQQLMAMAAQAAGQPSQLPVDADDVEPYLGEYERGVTVELRDGSLWLTVDYDSIQLLPMPASGGREFSAAGLLGTTHVRFEEQDGVMTLTLFDTFQSDATPLTLAKLG